MTSLLLGLALVVGAAAIVAAGVRVATAARHLRDAARAWRDARLPALSAVGAARHDLAGQAVSFRGEAGVLRIARERLAVSTAVLGLLVEAGDDAVSPLRRWWRLTR